MGLDICVYGHYHCWILALIDTIVWACNDTSNIIHLPLNIWNWGLDSTGGSWLLHMQWYLLWSLQWCQQHHLSTHLLNIHWCLRAHNDFNDVTTVSSLPINILRKSLMSSPFGLVMMWWQCPFSSMTVHMHTLLLRQKHPLPQYIYPLGLNIGILTWDNLFA